jgi:hypothetical protein
VAPIPPGAIPETIPAGGEARDDSIRATLRDFLSRSPLPPPPGRPAPVLAAWLVDLLTRGEAADVDAITMGTNPASWARADTFHVLPLAAALALAERRMPARALDWLNEGHTGRFDHPYRSLLAIELFDLAGDSAAAVAKAEAVLRSDPGEDWTLPAARRLLLALEKSGNPAEVLVATARMRKALGRGADETAARFRALTALGRAEEARSVGDTLLRLFPGARTARVESLRRFRTDPDGAARREGPVLFGVFMKHGLFAQADSLLDRMPGTDSLRVVLWEGLLAARRPSDVLADSLAWGQRWSGDLTARHRLVRARAARNANRRSAMDDGYRAAAALGGATKRTALTEWAREAESDCREALAESLYTELMTLPQAAEEARYRRGLARFASGRPEAARSDFEQLGGGDWTAASAYWIFRIADGAADSASARAALVRAASAADGYYARRARAEIAWREEARTGGGFWGATRDWLFSPAERAVVERGSRIACSRGIGSRVRAGRILMLRRFGRTDWAEREVDRLQSEVGAADRRDRFFCLGLPDLGIRLAVAGGGSPLALRYPRPFASMVEREARGAGIAPELVWAIARRESLFDPGAVSGAGARGLLQLMDATAAETAERWGLPDGPLEREDRNLALGTRHLRDLRERSEWHLPALLAAYNAGAAKTAEWVASFGDVDLFIERIGWRETREYVRAVLDACWIYRSEVAGAAGGN